MTVHKRSIPTAAENSKATPFKVFVPRELELEPAKAIWDALRESTSITLADPFALPGVSTVFPGVLFDVVDSYDLSPVANILTQLEAQYPEALEDAWVELWVPDALTDEAEALDVTDLTES